MGGVKVGTRQYITRGGPLLQRGVSGSALDTPRRRCDVMVFGFRRLLAHRIPPERKGRYNPYPANAIPPDRKDDRTLDENHTGQQRRNICHNNGPP